MEWMKLLDEAVRYIEDNITENIDADMVAKRINVSSSYFQRAFQIFSGYTVGEYIRARRLYLAATDIRSESTAVTEAAFKYGYETVEAFTKAFTRFHGNSPSKAKHSSGTIKVFLPLKLEIAKYGGYEMDFVIEKEKDFTLIGFETAIPFNQGYNLCPKFWDEFRKKYLSRLDDGSEISRAIIENDIGEFGICCDDFDDGKFRYAIAGRYKGGNVPEGMILKHFDDMTWIKFKCIGPMPGALQALNTKVWDEWVPNCKKYELVGKANIEWYAMGDIKAMDYEAGIWLPIREKE
jgi:AraC family transcriptional regulator